MAVLGIINRWIFLVNPFIAGKKNYFCEKDFPLIETNSILM